MSNHGASMNPDDPRQYSNLVEPHFRAAKRAYPASVECCSSRWILERNTVDDFNCKLVLAEYSSDGNPHPVHHWTFQCDIVDLCFHCHKGYGDGVCWKHQALYTVLSTWRSADDRIEQAMLPAHRWLDQHVIVKLTILLVMALACCWALWYAQIVIPYHNQQMLIAGIIAIALIYVSASIAALFGWRQLRMSEQADISMGDEHGEA